MDHYVGSDTVLIQLTKNFNLKEFAVSSSRPDLAIHITFSEAEIAKAYYLSAIILQPVRGIFGRQRILSGKRSLELNVAVGGSTNSDHLYTMSDEDGPKAAVDFAPQEANVEDVYEHIKSTRHGSYGQLILYRRSKFIHCSLPSRKHLNEAWEWER